MRADSKLRAGGFRATLVAIAIGVLGLAAAPGALAHVLWTDYGGTEFGTTVGRANLDGSGVNHGFITGADAPAGVATDASHVYWSNYQANKIGRANLDGSAANQAFMSVTNAYGLAVDGAHIYWTDVGTSIGRANLDGSGVDANFISASGRADAMAVDGAHVYWVNWVSGAGSIGRANLDGSGVDQNFIAGTNGPDGVAVDGSHVYWANYSNGTIGRANLDGSGADQNFITGVASPQGVAVDAAHVYWSNNATNAIGRANIDGSGANQSFITGADGPTAVTVTPLDTAIVGGPAGTVKTSRAGFSFAGSEPGGFQCRLDAGSFSACGSPVGYSGLKTGTHSFEVRATDSSGNVDPTPAGRTWAVDATPPALTGYRLSHHAFAAASRGKSVAAARRAKIGTRVRYRLSERATVRFTIERAVRGRKVHGRCRKPTAKNRRAKRCVRYVKLRGGFSRLGVRGANSFKFTGRLRGRKLRPGRYRLVAQARDALGNKAKAKRLKFKIVRR